MTEIVIATDCSPPAQEAVDVGLELAKEQGAHVTFVHVTEPEEVRGGRGGSHPLTHTEEIDETEKALKAAGEAAEEAGVSYTLERVAGDTVESIVAVADEQKADLIVLGSRGRGPVTSALLGSVSHAVLRRASRPVLVVKTTKATADTAA